jgi:hypothetical protein
MPLRSGTPVASVVAASACAALAALRLLAAGQPLFTDDLWWHLALGEAYARHGPWLEADPLLYTAPGPPAPAAWLGDLALFGVERVAGFQGLRVAHVLLVGGILGLAWSLLRRAAGSRAAASLGTGVFVVLAAYRLVQLRPHLFSMLAALLLCRLLLEPGALPSRRRVALAVVLLAVWSNLHGGFLLGPLLIAAALAGVVAAVPLGLGRWGARERARARHLTLALFLGLAATLLNPQGAEPHQAWFVAGGETPSLTRVGDEWLPVAPFRLPLRRLPPTPLVWGLYWSLLVATPCACVAALARARRSRDTTPTTASDPAVLAVGVLSVMAPLLAVRFLWLGIFPLLGLSGWARTGLPAGRAPRRWLAWGAAGFGVLLVPGFLRLGDWPMISGGITRAPSAYARPYAATKYYAEVVWLLEDSGVEGNLFNEYFLGGFLGYWLAPEVRCFVNGSLNVSLDAMRANLPIRERRGERAGESYLELLDRHRVDLFFGIRAPVISPPGRPRFYTTSHLEGAEGWRLVFRNLRSSLYLRVDPRNARNLERLAAYYASQGVPFDPARGFDVARVLEAAPAWAIAHGLAPADFDRLLTDAHAPEVGRRTAALDALASIYAALGLYERAVEIDRRLAPSLPGASAPRRRLVWSLLRLGRAADAHEAARSLGAVSPADGVSRRLIQAARVYPRLDPEQAAALVARLPIFTPAEAAALFARVPPPPVRGMRGDASRGSSASP